METKPNEKKDKNKKEAAKILYIVIAGVLCVSAVITGITLNLTSKVPNDSSSTSGPATSAPIKDPVNKPVEQQLPVFSSPAAGLVSRRHDLSLPVFSPTLGAYKVHHGMDITTELGAEVRASAEGTVADVYNDPMYGRCVSISHSGGAVTVYANLDETLAEGIVKGASVRSGQLLGKVGSTAMCEIADEPHLHFEMQVSGKEVDPLEYISTESQKASLTFNDSAYEG